MSPDISIWSRGVDRDQFNPSRRSEEFRARHGIAPDDMVVVFLGRVVLEKGLDVFADAVDGARAKAVPLKILVIGEGPARSWFAERLPDAIFVGQLTGVELAEALASADVFFNPSITEAFGNVTQEAMACSLPVVAAAASGANSLVINGVTGTLIDPGDLDGFARALALYQADPALRVRHGAAGLAFTKTRDWDTINAAVMQTYARIIERRRPR